MLVFQRRFGVILAVTLALLVGACSSDPNEDGELIITDITPGDGPQVELGHALIVNYVGKFEDGTIFDSTEEKGESFIFTLGVGQVIEGWDKGLVGMKVGGTRRLEIPSHMAFGRTGQCFSDGTCSVPENTDVVYEVTIVDIFDEVIFEDEKVGDGEVAELGDFLVVDYVGQLRDGTVFDASADHGGSFGFFLGQGSVISGWDQGIPGMRVGGRRVLTIPPLLAYGSTGIPGSIPQFAVLTFTIDLREVVKDTNGSG